MIARFNKLKSCIACLAAHFCQYLLLISLTCIHKRTQKNHKILAKIVFLKNNVSTNFLSYVVKVKNFLAKFLALKRAFELNTYQKDRAGCL